MTDETEVGIYFYPEGHVPEERMGGGVGNASLSLSRPVQKTTKWSWSPIFEKSLTFTA